MPRKGARFNPPDAKDDAVDGTTVEGMLAAVKDSLSLGAKRLKSGEKAKVNINAILSLQNDGTVKVKLANTLSLKRDLGTHQVSLF